MDRTLKKIYYDTQNPACFGSIVALLREANKVEKVTRKQVVEFLAKQRTYTLHKQRRKKFKRNVIKSAGIDTDWQLDLADMSMLKKENDCTFLLICVDVYSRFARVVPLKNKTAAHVASAMSSIEKMPWSVTTDAGKEFTGKAFQQFLYANDINHKLATSPDVKASIAERYIRTLKGRLWKFMTAYNTKRYIDVLPMIVTSINNSYHRAIKAVPASITRQNQHKVVKTSPTKPRFNVGDKVRISIEKGIMTKGYKPNYSEEVFTVSKILHRHPATYTLSDAVEQITGIFYDEELVLVLPGSKVQPIKVLRSERRGAELWHLIEIRNRKKWITNSELVTK